MKIFVGIPCARHYKPFWSSMDSFIPALKKEVEVESHTVFDQDIATARNEIAEKFLASDADYLLFLDDDHSGHTIEMFDALLDPMLENSAYVCAIKCYKRAFPYDTNLLVRSGANEKELGLKEGMGRYQAIDLDKGYSYLDVVGFGMTLIKRMAFLTVGKPYFVSKNNCNEDNYFCEQLGIRGIQPVGCFEHTLQHADIGQHNARKLRNEGFEKLKKQHPDLRVLVA